MNPTATILIGLVVFMLAFIALFGPMVRKYLGRIDQENREQRDEQRDACARRTGLTVSDGDLRGTLDGFRVSALQQTEKGGGRVVSTTFAIEMPPSLGTDAWISDEQLWLAVGSEVEARARREWRPEPGRLTKVVEGGTSTPEVVLAEGIAIVKALEAANADRPAHLAARARDDPSAPWRSEVLRELERSKTRGGMWATSFASAMDAALKDPNDALRLYAARIRHDVPVLEALAHAGGLEALAILAAEPASHESAQRVMRAWMASPSSLTPAQQAALVKTLGQVSVDGAEATLLALADTADAEVLFDVLYLLGNIGTVASVPRLVALRHHAHGRHAADLADAITAIQARIKGAEAGALALAEATGGDLALVDGASQRQSETVPG
jgi:hypothetical protein